MSKKKDYFKLRKDSKIRRWLNRLYLRIHFYLFLKRGTDSDDVK